MMGFVSRIFLVHRCLFGLRLWVTEPVAFVCVVHGSALITVGICLGFLKVSLL